MHILCTRKIFLKTGRLQYIKFLFPGLAPNQTTHIFPSIVWLHAHSTAPSYLLPYSLQAKIEATNQNVKLYLVIELAGVPPYWHILVWEELNCRYLYSKILRVKCARGESPGLWTVTINYFCWIAASVINVWLVVSILVCLEWRGKWTSYLKCGGKGKIIFFFICWLPPLQQCIYVIYRTLCWLSYSILILQFLKYCIYESGLDMCNLFWSEYIFRQTFCNSEIRMYLNPWIK